MILEALEQNLLAIVSSYFILPPSTYPRTPLRPTVNCAVELFNLFSLAPLLLRLLLLLFSHTHLRRT